MIWGQTENCTNRFPFSENIHFQWHSLFISTIIFSFIGDISVKTRFRFLYKRCLPRLLRNISAAVNKLVKVLDKWIIYFFFKNFDISVIISQNEFSENLNWFFISYSSLSRIFGIFLVILMSFIDTVRKPIKKRIVNSVVFLCFYHLFTKKLLL